MPLRLGEGELVSPTVELVAPVLQPVRPRGQHLAAPRRARRVERVAVEEISAACRVGAEPAADLDHHDPLVGVNELELLPRGWRRSVHGRQRSRASRWSPTRSAFAMAVSAGFTAPMLGKKLVSTT